MFTLSSSHSAPVHNDADWGRGSARGTGTPGLGQKPPAEIASLCSGGAADQPIQTVVSAASLPSVSGPEEARTVPVGRATGSPDTFAMTVTSPLRSASTPSSDGSHDSVPVPSECSLRSVRSERYSSSVEPSTPSCASREYDAHDAGWGSQEAPDSLKPYDAPVVLHGRGTRQPSRP